MALLIAVGLRLLWVLYVNVDPNDGRLDDSVFYHNVAHSLASGAGYIDPWRQELSVGWPPGYPATLAVLYKLFGWHLALAKVLNIAFAAVTVALVYLIARRVLDRRVAILGALLLAVFPGQIYFSTLVLAETFFAMVFVLTLFLALFWTVERDGSWWQVLVLGIVVGFAGLVRSEGILLVPIVVVLWLLTVRPWGRVVRYVPLLLVGLVLILTPWTVRNAVQMDQFIPLRGGAGGYIASGLNPNVFPEAYTGVAGFNPPQPPLRETLTHWSTHPWELPRFVWLKLQKLYENDDEGIFWVQVNPLYLDEGEVAFWTNLANVYFFTIGAVALLTIPFSIARGGRGLLAVLVFVIGWSLVFILFVPYSRYHFPVVPLLSILAAASAIGLWDRTVGLRERLSGPAGGT